jgi:hypothetical protein
MMIMDNKRFRIRHPVMENKFISRLPKRSVREARTLNRMDQKSITMFLNLNGLSAKDIRSELAQALGSDTIAYRPGQSIYGTISFCKMNLNPRIELKIKVSRLQTMQFWIHLK